MASLGKIARRSFLFGSVAIAGGVAFGVYKVRTPYGNPLETDLAAGDATFNPWVMINAEKITLITPHGDIGQGAASVQAMLIAEELDLEMDQFDISFGKPDKAYWNTALGADGAPVKSTDDSFGANAQRTVFTSLFKLLGMQVTGGSSTVPDGFVKLREAGAIARETLKGAAAKKTGLPLSQLKTARGAVILPDGTALPYVELAEIAAGLEPVQDVALRDPSQWRLIGKPAERLDIVPKSTGIISYGIDLQIEGMKHATIICNPRKGGVLNSYDASAARDMRGIEAIIEVTGGVAVVANNTWRAIQAAQAIEYDWGPAPYPAEQAQHWDEIDASFTEDRLDKVWRNDGDVDAALSSETVIEAKYRSPYVAHQPLEPLNAIVRVDADQVEVWTGHQMPRIVQQEVAKVTGHDKDQVTFHNQFMGGSFGHRLEFDYITRCAEIATSMPGVPIKLTYSREEDFVHDFTRQPGAARAKGTVKDSKVTTIDLRIAAPSVVSSQFGRIGMAPPGPDSQIVWGSWNNPYDLPNFRVTGYRVPELAPISSWRSVGAPLGGFFFDTFLDELIHKAGADPMEERIRLISDDTSRMALEAVADMSNWGSALPDGSARGVAFVESFGVPVAMVVEVSTPGGLVKLDKVWIAADVGTIIDPVNFENLVQGGVVFGLGHAINSEITYSDGMSEQLNYYDAEGMRLYQTPEIMVKGLENGAHIRGIGEPPVPVTAPALGNAIFAATGTRLREMPFNKFIDFV